MFVEKERYKNIISKIVEELDLECRCELEIVRSDFFKGACILCTSDIFSDKLNEYLNHYKYFSRNFIGYPIFGNRLLICKRAET